MSIDYVDYSCIDVPDNIEDILNRYEESFAAKNRQDLFTEDELKLLLRLCHLAEYQAERAMDAATDYRIIGFSLVSDDRLIVEEMLANKLDKQAASFLCSAINSSQEEVA